MPLIFPYSAQILLENALLCRQNARLKNRLLYSKFCRSNLSKPNPLTRKHITREVSKNLKIKFNQQFISTLQCKHRFFVVVFFSGVRDFRHYKKRVQRGAQYFSTEDNILVREINFKHLRMSKWYPTNCSILWLFKSIVLDRFSC